MEILADVMEVMAIFSGFWFCYVPAAMEMAMAFSVMADVTTASLAMATAATGFLFSSYFPAAVTSKVSFQAKNADKTVYCSVSVLFLFLSLIIVVPVTGKEIYHLLDGIQVLSLFIRSIINFMRYRA